MVWYDVVRAWLQLMSDVPPSFNLIGWIPAIVPLTGAGFFGPDRVDLWESVKVSFLGASALVTFLSVRSPGLFRHIHLGHH